MEKILITRNNNDVEIEMISDGHVSSIKLELSKSFSFENACMYGIMKLFEEGDLTLKN